MKKASFMIKDDRNLCKSRFGCYFRLSLVNFKKKLLFFFWTYMLFMARENIEEELPWFWTYKKQLVIHDPESLISYFHIWNKIQIRVW